MPDISTLRIPEPLPSITEVWPSEAKDFTPWLAENLGVLDVLGLGRLELVERERAVPGTLRSLDLLARRPTGELVAVENQFGRTDHDHLTRGLAYAVGLEANDLVVVAEDHLPEFCAVARYLNDVAERSEAASRIGVHLVQVAVEKVEAFHIPRFTVLEAPNSWTETIQKPPADRLSSLEEFLGRVDVPVREAVRSLCDWWTSSSGSIRLGARNVSLDRSSPVVSRLVSNFVVYTNGSSWLNRGYLLPIIGDRVDEFDELVKAVLPTLRPGEKGYYWVSPTPLPIDGVQKVITWLEEEPRAE